MTALNPSQTAVHKLFVATSGHSIPNKTIKCPSFPSTTTVVRYEPTTDENHLTKTDSFLPGPMTKQLTHNSVFILIFFFFLSGVFSFVFWIICKFPLSRVM